jgi:hypothetical protein
MSLSQWAVFPNIHTFSTVNKKEQRTRQLSPLAQTTLVLIESVFGTCPV